MQGTCHPARPVCSGTVAPGVSREGHGTPWAGVSCGRLNNTLRFSDISGQCGEQATLLSQ